MEFNEENIVDVDSVNNIQAEEYITFLIEERERHDELAIRYNARSVLWGSEAKRQERDVIFTDAKIKELREKFDLRD